MQIIKQFSIALLIFIGILSSLKGQGYNNFDKGFQSGFKQGYCYNQNVGCLVPQTPITPITRIGESQNSYTDGYNRGFQVALDMQRVNSASINSNRYVENNKPISSFRTSEYVPPVDLNLLKDVVQYKQRIFDSRSRWVQSRINDITDLNYSLLSERDRNSYSNIDKQIQDYINKQLNQRNPDLTDNNIFSQIESSFHNFQTLIVDKYNNLKSGSNINSAQTNSNNSTQKNDIYDNSTNPCIVSLNWKNIGNYQSYIKDLNGNIIADDLIVTVLPFDNEKIIIAYSYKFNSTYVESIHPDIDSYTGQGKTIVLDLVGKSSSIRVYGKKITPIFFEKGVRQENIVDAGEESLQMVGTNDKLTLKIFIDTKTKNKFYVNPDGYEDGLKEPKFHIELIYSN